MKAPKSETKRELVPEGNHVSTLYEIVYLGTMETPYFNDDGSVKEQYKVRLTFELPDELREFGPDNEKLPMVISKECNFSMYKGTQTAVLRTIAHALVGQALTDEEAEAFDIDDLLGKSCMLEVSHEEYEGKKYAKAVGFGSLPKGVKAPKQVNESRTKSVHDMTEDEIFELPEFISKKMTSSKEYQERFGGTGKADIEEADKNSNNGVTPDGIPF